MYQNVNILEELSVSSCFMKFQVSATEGLMAGLVLHDHLLPSGKRLQQMIEQFKSKCDYAIQSYHHPNIVKYFGLCNKPPYKFPMILQEYVEENLALFLERTKDTLTFRRKLKISCEIASGLEFLHAQPIMHKNLHPSNILIDKDGCAKISDLVAPQVDDVQFLSQTNHVYIAPEVLRDHKHFSYKSDIFSLGVVNLQLFTEVSLTNENLQETVQSIDYKPLKRLICSCITDNAIDRPNAIEIYEQILEIQNSPTAVAYDALTSKVSYL